MVVDLLLIVFWKLGIVFTMSRQAIKIQFLGPKLKENVPIRDLKMT